MNKTLKPKYTFVNVIFFVSYAISVTIKIFTGEMTVLTMIGVCLYLILLFLPLFFDDDNVNDFKE